MNRVVPRIRSFSGSLFALGLCLLAPLSFSCKTGNGLDSEGGGGAQTIASTSSSSVATGTGGSGGTSLCKQDCSKVNTSDCLKSVCNDGSFAGTVGECVVVNRDDGTDCEDGKFCTVGDKCTNGVCIGGTQNDCDMTPDECSVLSCDETSKTCKNVAGKNGDQCTPDDLCSSTGTCSGGKCVGEPLDCSFSPFGECNDVACNPATGVCEPTADSGLDGHSCSLTGDQCNTGKVCLNGSCQGGTPITCTSSGIECKPNVCNSQTGICEPTALDVGAPCLGAADQCNTGACDANGACAPSPVADNTKCNDKDSCTSGDVCTAGVCDGTAVNGCAPLYEVDFETCPDGWTLTGDWQCGPVIAGPKAAESGVNALGTNLSVGTYKASDKIPSDVATSDVIDLTGTVAPVLEFYLWVDTEGSTHDGGNLQISTDGGVTFSLLTTSKVYPLTLTDAGQGSAKAWGGHDTALGWQLVTADMTPYVGKHVQLRFAFGSDSSLQYSGIYVDQIRVSEANQIPLQITTTNLAGGGVNQPYNSPLDHSGGTSGAKWSILPGGTNSSWLTIDSSTGKLGGTPLATNIGPVTVTVQVAEPSLPSNVDQKTFTFDVGNVFYNQSFDGTCANTGWAFTGDFACGVPTTVGPPAPFDGIQCFGTNLTGNYKASDAYSTNTVTSAVLNLTPTTKPKLNFFAWKDTEPGADGFDVLVSADGGTTFTLVTAVTPAYGGLVKAQQAWSGHAPEWLPYTVDLGAYAGQATVRIRFAFASDSTNQFPGVYIDDVYITDP